MPTRNTLLDPTYHLRNPTIKSKSRQLTSNPIFPYLTTSAALQDALTSVHLQPDSCHVTCQGSDAPMWRCRHTIVRTAGELEVSSHPPRCVFRPRSCLSPFKSHMCAGRRGMRFVWLKCACVVSDTRPRWQTERLKWESNNHHVAPLKPLLGLFADHDLQYEVDRAGYQGGREPHLKDVCRPPNTPRSLPKPAS